MGSAAIFNGNYVKLLKKALRLGSQASAPTSPAQGDVYYDSSLVKLQVYNGSAWVDVSPSSVNTTLSNLTNPTAINQDLIFNTGALAKLKTKDDSAVTKDLDIRTGDSSATNSGNIDIVTGSSPTGRGSLNLDASNITLQSNIGDLTLAATGGGNLTLSGATIDASGLPIDDLADPTTPQQAATKNYVDSIVLPVPITYTPTITGFGTVTSLNAGYTKLGNSLLFGFVNFTSGTSTAAVASFTLPLGLVPNAIITITTQIGSGTRNVANNNALGVYAVVGSNLCEFGLYGTSNAPIGQLGTSIANSGDTITLTFTLPI